MALNASDRTNPISARNVSLDGYYFSSLYSVKRSLYIDNVLYTISDKKIKMNSLENLDEINEVEFP